VTAVYLFGFFNTLWLTGLVTGFLWITTLDISHRTKVWIVVSAGLLLAVMKAGVIPEVVPSTMITVVASMLMFRMIIYLYDLRHEKEAPSFERRLGYFFMLPNLIFPIFPIVDYKVYKSTYYNAEDNTIYERGVLMIVRGVLHLLVYRLVYMYMIPPVEEITGLFDLVQYLVMSYVTILRLSGMFHMAVGILLLFGFNLPEIFNNYFLASGFSDYWRRINIYWKDFVLKIFYYPLYFKVKHWGALAAVVFTTMVVFLANWILHVYQWFWVLGKVYVRSTDIAFWTIFGVLVTISAVFQQRRRRRLDVKSWEYGFSQTAKILLTFSLAALMWSIWISPTFESWFGIMSVIRDTDWISWAQLTLVIGGILILGAFLHHWYFNRIKDSAAEAWILRVNLPVMASILAVLLILTTHRGRDFVESQYDFSMESLMTMSLNESDKSAQFEGYYEEILTANNLSSPLWQMKNEEDDEARLQRNPIIVKTGDILVNELRPSFESEFKGKRVTSNKWGMRDQEYTRIPRENVTRFALVGGSIEMGSGVTNDEVFENLLEVRLNKNSDSIQYEVLNFSLSARNLIQHAYDLETNVVDFEPDYVLFINHDREWNAIANLFFKVISDRSDLDRFPYDFLNDIVEEMSLEPNSSREEVIREIVPYLSRIYEGVYQQVAVTCKARNIQPIWVHLPSLEPEGSVKIPVDKAKEMALNAGFDTIVLEDVFEGYDKEDLKLTKNDIHPNAKGHELIAEALYRELNEYLENK
ncbi:MAG: hypothetical protein R3275_13865, partial [Saprospiraceae bacterium]|nr:hypothetical protein [Saprospiraceae bacterium]